VRSEILQPIKDIREICRKMILGLGYHLMREESVFTVYKRDRTT
jgi:hypothetical protein